MRFLNKRRVLALLVLSFYLLSPVASWACTSMIVGKDASTTGRPLFARTEDSQPNGSKKFIVVPAGFYKANTEYLLDAQGFKWTFSHDSYKFTAVPDTSRLGISALGGEAASKDAVPHWEDGFHFTFDSNGVNEKGFAVSATTTTGFRSGIGMPTGTSQWTERTMAKLLLAEAATCREAMDVVDKLLAPGAGQQGMANEIIHMADQNEAWILEAVGRYYYVASRVPDDSFTVLANAMQHQFFDENDPVNFRSNFKPNTYAEEHGFARYQIDENGVKRVNISLTYGPTSLSGVNGEGNATRRWRGMTMFAPSQGSKIKLLTEADYYGGGGTSATSSDTGVTYPNYIKPDRKISPMDIAWLQRDRYAGTPFDQTYSPQYLNANGGEVREGTTASGIVTALPPGSPMPTPTPAGAAGVRTIGYFTQQHTHIYDVGGNLPPEIGARFWIGMAAAETSVNLPFYGNITDTHPRHKFNITAENTATTGNGINTVPPYDPNSGYSLFSHTGYLARGDRKNYVVPIQAFWRAYELKLYEDQEKIIEPEILRLYKEVSPAASAKFATDYTIAVADRAFRAAEKIHDALVAHMAAAPNTLFVIPAELLEPAINDSALITPTDEDKKAVDDARGAGNNLLTRDDGNVQVTAVGANAAPSVDGYIFNMPGASINIALKPEQVAAKQIAAKMLYEVKLDNAQINAFGNLDSLKKNLAFVMDINGKALKIVGPDTNVLTSFTNALANGIATLTLTSDGAIVTVEYILVDGPGNSGVYNNALVVSDGVADGALVSSIWLAVPGIDTIPPGEGGCDSGIGFAVVGLFAMLIFEMRKKK
ncbi:MAG: C69 family dipeptidase [Oscillospiraceae bacterium]|nr:C69 family dipeptidase [Oscillospiraceae bacterium]